VIGISSYSAVSKPVTSGIGPGFLLGRTNYLFAGSDAGLRRVARLDPQNYLADVLACIADHPARRISELLPWNWTPAPAKLAA
jgi:transposase